MKPSHEVSPRPSRDNETTAALAPRVCVRSTPKAIIFALCFSILVMLHQRTPHLLWKISQDGRTEVLWKKHERWQHDPHNENYSSFECFVSARTQHTPTCLFHNVCFHKHHGLLFFSNNPLPLAAMMELPPLRISPRLEHQAPEIVPFVLTKAIPALKQFALGLVLAPPDWNYVRAPQRSKRTALSYLLTGAPHF